MNILIRHVMLNGKSVDIAIEGNRIATIGNISAEQPFDTVIDGSHLIAAPAFYNSHAHSPMTLLRGYADDMELMDWLQNHIWPAEARFVREDYYWGTKLACLESIKTGTVFFNDMYFVPQETIRAIEEMGMRATIGMSVLELSPKLEEMLADNRFIWEHREAYSSRIQLSIAPHAIYT